MCVSSCESSSLSGSQCFTIVLCFKTFLKICAVGTNDSTHSFFIIVKLKDILSSERHNWLLNIQINMAVNTLIYSPSPPACLSSSQHEYSNTHLLITMFYFVGVKLLVVQNIELSKYFTNCIVSKDN